MAELKTLVDEMSKNAGAALESDAAIALRRIERAARMMVTVRPNTNEFQLLLGRVLAPAPGTYGREEGAAGEAPAPSSLIIP